MGFFVPETLKNCNQWIVQREKVPYSPKTGHKCSVMDPAHWGSYGEALERLENGDFDGLGFVFTAEDDFVFIDLDSCLDDDGEPNDFAKEILSVIPETYTEISLSETGLHIICKGQIPRGFRGENIEVYSSGRYVAFTGNATSYTEPQEAQKGINALFEKYAVTAKEEAPQRTYTPIARSATASQVISVICNGKNGEKFKLLHEGKWMNTTDRNGKPFESQSNAEMAYIAILYHTVGDNYELIREIYTSSGFMNRRKNINRVDYLLERMIREARRTFTGTVMKGIVQRTAVTDQPKRKKVRRF